MDYRHLEDIDFKMPFDKVERLIETKYDLRVIISDVLDPNTGDFDGLEIKIDYAQTIEVGLFILAHLFGHTVQWNVSEEYRKLGEEIVPKEITPEKLAKIHEYEEKASRFALKLFHEAGVTHLDQWLSDWADADWRYLQNLYTTGAKTAPQILNRFKEIYLEYGKSMLKPLNIPEFTPKKWISRYSF